MENGNQKNIRLYSACDISKNHRLGTEKTAYHQRRHAAAAARWPIADAFFTAPDVIF